MKKILFILSILFLFIGASSPSKSYFVGRKLFYKGGDTTFNTLYPGDTVFLNNKNGYIGDVTFNYCRGTKANPIVIINDPSQDSVVKFRGLHSRLQFNGCWNIKVSGKGRSSLMYGLDFEHFPGTMSQWGGADYFPLAFSQKSKNIEIEGVYLNKVSTGIVIKEDPYCLDSLNKTPSNPFIIDSILIHDNKIERIFNEGMYLGNTLPDNNPEGYIFNDTKRPWVCTNIYTGTVRFKASDSTIRFQGNHTAQMPPGMYFRVGGASAGHNNDYNQSWVVKSYAGASTYVGDTTILHVRNIDLTHASNWMSDEKFASGSIDSVKFNLPMRLGYAHIWNNIIDSTGRGGIQYSSANGVRSEINNNTVSHAGLARVGGQGNGITWGKYTSVWCHDNIINCTVAEGIHITGGGRTGVPQTVENNRIDSSGYCNAYVNLYVGNFAIYDIINDAGNNWVAAIAFRTRGCDSLPALDSTMFVIKNNKVGIFTLSRQTTWDNKKYGGILIEDYNQSTQRSGNQIYGNTKLDGITRLLNHTDTIVQLQYDGGGGQSSPVYSTSNTLKSAPSVTASWVKTTNTSVTLTGIATDRDGSISSHVWTKTTGTGGTITSPSSYSTTVTGLTIGKTYTFKFSATDNDGKTSSVILTIKL